MRDAVVEQLEFPASARAAARSGSKPGAASRRARSARRGVTVASAASVELSRARRQRHCLHPRRRRVACSSISARRFRRTACCCPVPTTSTAPTACPIARRACLAALQSMLNTGRLAGTGYVSILPGRSGHRAFGRRVVRAEPGVLRSREHRQAGDRGRLQRRRVDARRARLGGAQVRAQDSVHREAQSQRVPLLPELRTIRFALPASSRRSTWARWAWARRSTSGRRSRSGRFRKSSAMFQQAHELGLFTVLWCYLRNPAFKTKEVDYHLVGRPDRAGQPPRRHDRGRHHQAEDAGEQRRLQRRQLRQDAQGRLLAAHERQPDRSDALSARQLLHGPRRSDQLGWRVVGRRTT